jgi:hypothetical protein
MIIKLPVTSSPAKQLESFFVMCSESSRLCRLCKSVCGGATVRLVGISCRHLLSRLLSGVAQEA